MIELEKTYIAKYLPSDLSSCFFKELIDIYFPPSVPHPNLRIRMNGDKYEITKKVRVDALDASKQEESTISLTKEEFEALSISPGKQVSKIRYHYLYQGRTAEIDIFRGALSGLVVVDFEFEKETEKNDFQMPDFCLADVTQEDFIAGGMLCGKTYSDIEPYLVKYGYTRIS
jgi:adenylate cyclase